MQKDRNVKRKKKRGGTNSVMKLRKSFIEIHQ